jgi:hypothetical protein
MLYVFVTIGAFLIFSVWPKGSHQVYGAVINWPLKITSSIVGKNPASTHYARSGNALKRAFALINQPDNPNPMSLKESTNVLMLLKEALEEAEMVDREDLAGINKDWPSSYENLYIAGLREMIAGFSMHDQRRLVKGATLLQRYQKWVNSNPGPSK